jgi:hypothetical protein
MPEASRTARSASVSDAYAPISQGSTGIVSSQDVMRGVVFLPIVGFLVANPATAAAQPSSVAVVVDRDMTVEAGTTDVLALQRALAYLEDRLLPTHFTETTPGTHALGIGYRIGKWVALDLPQDEFLMVVAHEVFGHGARLRELGATGVTYSFDAPPPYGDGSATTSFNENVLATATRADVLGIDTAGIEAQNVLANTIGRDALAGGALSYRDAWLYVQSRVAGLLYIESVTPQSPPGHDVGDFLRDFNAGCQPPACRPLTTTSLKQQALLMLGDPILAYSAYGFAVSYLVHGRTVAAVPMIPVADGLDYLPTVGFAMTPYGTEWTTEHNLRAGRRLIRIVLRFGDAGATHPWGAGVIATHIARVGPVVADVSADFWRQPPLDESPSSPVLTAGGLAAVTANVALGHGGRSGRLAVIAQVGYKSAGFVPGERLRAGAVVRAGLTVGLDGSLRTDP